MKMKKLYVSTTHKPVTRAKIWKLMADEFASHWMNDKWFLLRTETKLVRTSGLPDSEERILEVFLEESQRDPGNLAIVARSPQRDTVLEIRKEMDPKIGAVLAISLCAALSGQLGQFSLKETGFFYGDSLIADLSNTEFLGDFLSSGRESFLKYEERMAAEKDRIIESSLMPLYRDHWSHFSEHGPEGTAERISTVTDVLFSREEMKKILRTLNELDEQIIPVHELNTEYLRADQAKLRAWNQLYQCFMNEVLEADETAETNIMNLFQPPFHELISLTSLDHQNSDEDASSALTYLKTQKRNLLIYRLNGEISPDYPVLIRILRILSEEPVFPDPLKGFEQRSQFLDLLKEMSMESMETGTANLEQAAFLGLLNLLLSDLPEDHELREKQVLIGLASAVALTIHNQEKAEITDDWSGYSALQDSSSFRDILHMDWPGVPDETVLTITALTAVTLMDCYFSSFGNDELFNFAQVAAIRFFEVLQEPERLQKPLSETEMVMFRFFFIFFTGLISEGKDRFWFIYSDQKPFDDELSGLSRRLCRTILDWMEKYASLHGLGMMYISYPIFWSLVHGEHPDPKDTDKFQNLFTDWARKNPVLRREEMLQIRLIPVFQPDPVLVSSHGVDYIFLSALEMIQADLPVKPIPGGIRFDMNLLNQSVRLLGKGLHFVPVLTFDKIIYSLNFQWDLMRSEHDLPDVLNGKGSHPLDGRTVQFDPYCKIRDAVLSQALFPMLDQIKTGSSAGTLMAVQVSRILEWFMQPEIIGRLNSKKKMNVIGSSYYLGEALTNLNFCEQAEKHLRFTESVLQQMMSVNQQLSEMQMNLLIDTQNALIRNAVKSGSERSREEAASKLIRFIEMDQKKGKRRNIRSFIFLLNAFAELTFIKPDPELIKKATAVLLQTEEVQKYQFINEAIDGFVVHQFLQETLQNLIEAALSIQDYEAAEYLSKKLVDCSVNDECKRKAAYEAVGSRGFLISLIQKGEKEADSLARKIYSIYTDSSLKQPDLTNQLLYTALAYLSKSKKHLFVDYGSVLKSTLVTVNIQAVIFRRINDLIQHPAFQYGHEYPDWAKLHTEAMNREILSEELRIPHWFWQNEFYKVCFDLEKLNELSSVADYQHFQQNLARAKKATERLERETKTDLSQIRARFDYIQRLGPILPALDQSDVFLMMDAAEKALTESVRKMDRDTLHLQFHLTCLRALAAVRQDNSDQLFLALRDAEEYRNLLNAAGDSSADEFLMIFLLMAAERASGRKETGKAEFCLQKAFSLFDGMKKLNHPDQILVIDSLLERIQQKSRNSSFTASKVKPFLKQARAIQDILRGMLMMGSKVILH